ncbi:helix-turn-helix domain-containing protein [Burkholderia pseudomallei]
MQRDAHGIMQATPEGVREAREHAGLTQEQAAALVYVDGRSWRKWELGERAMHPAYFELFLIKTGAMTQ